MSNQRIWQDCKDCKSSGIMYVRADFAYPEVTAPDEGSYEEIVCPFCEGLKRIPWGWLEGV